MYGLCAVFLIFDLLYFCLIIFQTIEGLLSLGFDIFYYLSVLCFLTLTSLTVLCYIGYLVKKNGNAIEKNTKKKKKTKHIIVVSCEDNDLKEKIHGVLNKHGDVVLSSADAIRDSEEDKLWYLSANIKKGINYEASISISDYDSRNLYEFSRNSFEKNNTLALISYDLEKAL